MFSVSFSSFPLARIYMKLIFSKTICLLTLTLGQPLYADDAGVAKVVILRGQVKAKLVDGSEIEVKADQSIPEGAVLQTADKSFVKLIFIDKSQMNLGPNSQMIINSFPKKEAGIITLVRGQIRSQVTKDYMEIDDKSKSKLYIKTKTAALGIRGTDFQVNFNPENQNTALITFEGKVAMAHIDKGAREDKFDQGKLERVVSSDKAVMVMHGQISAVNLNVAERAMSPTLLGTKQIDALKENETGVKEASDDKKQYRNPLPPGADSAIFSNVSPEMSKGPDNSPKGDPSGFFNSKTGEYKLPAGSIVDLNTVNIIPPPANAIFDPNTKTYVVPESFGKIDKNTGEYVAPAGLKLGTDGKFVLVDAEAYAKSQVVNKEEKKEEGKEEGKEDAKEEKKEDGKEEKKEEGKDKKEDSKKEDKKDEVKTADASTPAPKEGDRGPASANNPEIPAAGPPPVFVIQQPVINLPPGWQPPNLRAPAAVVPPIINPRVLLEEKDRIKETATNLGTISPTSKVKFIFNAQ